MCPIVALNTAHRFRWTRTLNCLPVLYRQLLSDFEVAVFNQGDAGHQNCEIRLHGCPREAICNPGSQAREASGRQGKMGCLAVPIPGSNRWVLAISTQKQKSRQIPDRGNQIWRRGRDSNPGRVTPQRFSRPPLSTTQPPLLKSTTTPARWAGGIFLHAACSPLDSGHPRQ